MTLRYLVIFGKKLPKLTVVNSFVEINSKTFWQIKGNAIVLGKEALVNMSKLTPIMLSHKQYIAYIRKRTLFLNLDYKALFEDDSIYQETRGNLK